MGPAPAAVPGSGAAAPAAPVDTMQTPMTVDDMLRLSVAADNAADPCPYSRAVRIQRMRAALATSAMESADVPLSRCGDGDGPGPVPGRARSLEPWACHFDGVVRPFRHGFVLGVDDAVVDEGLDRRRSVFVDAFAENGLVHGDLILRRCRDLHRVGCRWDDVLELCEDLRDVARAELRGGTSAAVARMRLLPRCRGMLLVGGTGYMVGSPSVLGYSA